jgi:hypothetical protein
MTAMATIKEIKKNYCDDVYTELAGMKDRIVKMQRDLVRMYPSQKEFVEKFERHLRELADQIDWKLQILSHACPYDWKGSSESEYEENSVSVGPSGNDYAGGYLGG